MQRFEFFLADLPVTTVTQNSVLSLRDKAWFVSRVTKEVGIDAAPAGIFRQHGDFIRGRLTLFRFQLEERFQCFKVIFNSLGAGLALGIVTRLIAETS